MADAKKICRVCGKEYTACRTQNSNSAVFRWQDVACSPDCGEEYLRRVLAARAPKEPQKKLEPCKKHEIPIEESIEEKPLNPAVAAEETEI